MEKRIVAVRPETCSGPGWFNQVLWVYERQEDGSIIEYGVQQEDWLTWPAASVMFSAAEAISEQLVHEASSKLLEEEEEED